MYSLLVPGSMMLHWVCTKKWWQAKHYNACCCCYISCAQWRNPPEITLFAPGTRRCNALNTLYFWLEITSSLY